MHGKEVDPLPPVIEISITKKAGVCEIFPKFLAKLKKLGQFALLCLDLFQNKNENNALHDSFNFFCPIASLMCYVYFQRSTEVYS